MDMTLFRQPTPPAVEPEQDIGERLQRMLNTVLRRWRFVLPIAGVVFLLVLAIDATGPRLYTATALLMPNITGRETVLPDGVLVNQGQDISAAEGQLEVLESPMLMRRVVDQLRLDEDPEWRDAPTNGLEALWSSISRAFAGAQPAATPTESQDELRSKIALNLAKAVSVNRRGSSYTVEISASSQSPVRAAEIANSVVEQYFAAETQARLDTVQRAQGWLTQRANALTTEVQAKEQAAESYRTSHGLSLAAGGDAGVGATSDVQTMLVEARADLVGKEARLAQVRSVVNAGGSADEIANALNSEAIVRLRTQENEQERALAELRRRYTDEHASVQAAVVSLQNIRQQIQQEIGRGTANLNNEVAVARARLGTLQSSFGMTTGVRGENDAAVIQYRELVRQAAAARGVQQALLQRLQEVSSQTDMPSTISRLITNATPPAFPSSPNLRAALVKALLLALLAGVGIAFLLEMLANTVRVSEDVERKLGVRPLTSVPELGRWELKSLPSFRRNPADYIAEKPMTAFAESIRVLRTVAMHASRGTNCTLMAVTSAVPMEGKTTIALCLARVAAMSGQKVLLLDCDLRRRSLSDLVGLEPTIGLVEILSGKATWREALQKDPESAASLILTAQATFSPEDLFSSDAMRDLLADLRNQFDMVILDCAPVLAVAETRVITQLVDMTTFVVRSERTNASELRTALHQLDNLDVRLLGVVLNRVDTHGLGRRSYGDALDYKYAGGGYFKA